MSLNAKSTRSIRKKDLTTQKTPFVAFKSFSFAHEATAGTTVISLTALTTPTSYAAQGFLQPSASDLAAANLLLYKRNLRLHSTIRGVLLEYDAYQVTGNATIRLNFEAEDGEIFVGIVSDVSKSGLQVIDGKTLVATGELPADTTDFVVGQAFSLNKYPLAQVGDVLVFLNGQQMFRNVGNATASVSADGNYEELDAGSGLSNTIRFNLTSPSALPVLVVSNGMLAERPDGSLRAEIETLAGQNDALIDTVAALAGVPTSNFRSAPNNVDLQTFGQRVIDLEETRAKLDEPNAWTSYQPIPGRTDGVAVSSGNVGEFLESGVSSVTARPVNAFSDVNSLVLTPGNWIITANIAGLAFAMTTPTLCVAALSTFSGNTVTDHVRGDNELSGPAPTASNADTNLCIVWKKSVTVGTTIYAKVECDAASGTFAARAKITAVRG